MQAPSLYHNVWNRIFPRKWVLGLFLILLFGIPRFNRVRRESGSILGAILTHAGFNFGMVFLFFYAL